MQGIVFTALSDCIIENFGLATWNETLEKVAPESEGIYTSSANYADEELFALVGELSNKTGLPAADLVKTLGIYIFPYLIQHMPDAHQPGMTLKSFLLSVDQVIHKEVKRLYPNSYLPTIEYSDPSSNLLIMKYHSKRKLCHLAEGLIEGAAQHFKESINIAHTQCMHNGYDCCHMEINLDGTP
ncbi:heme NO-binding domain-containing protein [Aliikangiella sp. IMCC44359]|uniref:heme NO-binding domain-containing protein n=1 Tax=Aliikangiella sp. IMCC44359 TaxID=3459125 RepID=UPI00403AA089